MDTLATSDIAGLVRAVLALSEESSRHVADKLRPARGEHVVARLYRPAAVPGR
ncbi:hypothetical protein J1G44_15655 [Cellulomonas sp. zg-ZUI199]|uniref:Uncharacterized protein n=1 Tax=Cellulomonas wangleii TaxID=2816956 RepID=A0ABX8D8R2_9CELL|nr:hypothetical protein [Cellulomonas wangleii]MBO0925914.1 hypothetical protein [Cellulomonas wangleii]QVI63220.1 hypothetical protein KG103_04790 [Cellulomonas wangleii]